jgi:hypothetical protein
VHVFMRAVLLVSIMLGFDLGVHNKKGKLDNIQM